MNKPFVDDPIVLERQMRLRSFKRVLGGIAAVLLLRLGYMDLARHDTYVMAADRNERDTYATPAPRGTIVDAAGRLMAYDLPSYSLLYARTAHASDLVATRLSPVLQRPRRDLLNTIANGDVGRVHVLLASHLSNRALTFVREHMSDLPGVRLMPDSVRIYPQGDTAAHVLGYINSIAPSHVREYVDQSGFPPTAKMGWSGVEGYYDAVLRGRPGKIVMEQNSQGFPVRMLPDTRDAKRGQTIRLTLDASFNHDVQTILQRQVTYLSLHGHRQVKHATVVALNPVTGAVLALASYPSYRPEWFVGGIDERTYRQRFAPAEEDWATQAPVAPGSVMKPLTALYALAAGTVTPETTVSCHGGLKLPATDGTVIHCWTRHGTVNLKQALAQSCDVYFYAASLSYGGWPPLHGERISHWLSVTRLQTLKHLESVQRAFGLGVDTGIDLPATASGYVNDRAGEVTDLPYTAIGQNQVFTPLELAVYTSMLANGGHRVTPHVVAAISGRPVRSPWPASFGELARLGITRRDLAAVREGLIATCNDPSGTAYATFHSGATIPYDVAGKTGTAETGVVAFDNAVFIGFAPVRHPRIALAVVVPGGGHGADSSGPVARAVLDRFFQTGSRKLPEAR